jgi:hypothetical protein
MKDKQYWSLIIYWNNLFRLKIVSSFLQLFYEILSETSAHRGLQSGVIS